MTSGGIYNDHLTRLKKHKINWNNEDGSYYNDLSIPQIKKIFNENGINENEIKIRSLKIDNQNNNLDYQTIIEFERIESK